MRGVLILMLVCIAGWAAEDDGQIRGVVTDVAKASVAGARVRLLAMDTRRTLLSTVSGRAGEFAFDKLPAGAYRLAISAPGFRAKSVEVTVAAGAEVLVGKIELEITSCDYPGVICDYVLLPGQEWPKDNRYSHGDLALTPGCGADVDKGSSLCFPDWESADRTADFRFTVTEDHQTIFAPKNGARLAEPNSARASCQGAVFLDRPIRVDGLSARSDLCLRTSEGRLAEIFFLSDMDPEIKQIRISYVTWK